MRLIEKAAKLVQKFGTSLLSTTTIIMQRKPKLNVLVIISRHLIIDLTTSST